MTRQTVVHPFVDDVSMLIALRCLLSCRWRSSRKTICELGRQDSRDLPPEEQPSPGFPSRERSPGGRLNSSPFLSCNQRAGGRLLLRTLHRPITGFSRLGRRRCSPKAKSGSPRVARRSRSLLFSSTGFDPVSFLVSPRNVLLPCPSCRNEKSHRSAALSDRSAKKDRRKS